MSADFLYDPNFLPWLIPVGPLLGFLIIVLATNRSRWVPATNRHEYGGHHPAYDGMSVPVVAPASRVLSVIVGLGGVTFAFAIALLVVLRVSQVDFVFGEHVFGSTAEWMSTGITNFNMGVMVDPLTTIMLIMVPLAVVCIFIYSIGYMAHDPRQARFFAMISLFAGAMLTLVVANNLLLLFIGWEIMGLCSYLLIGFWFEKEVAYKAAVKAFMTTRVADVIMLLGIAYLYSITGTLNFRDILYNTEVLETLANTPAILIGGMSASGLIGIFLITGTIGKSAQFPLHVWLPDAMEGPTPVSAMIHAAAMVSAGVYAILRMYPLLEAGSHPHAGEFNSPLLLMAIVGGFTALFSATIAVAQNDVKKVLAFSTISQLGFMMAALGIGAYIAAAFHLITHAFFKALMFLGSGQVIEGCHHEQDIRKMGGLRSKMPVTCWTFLIGVLAIAGFGLPGAHLGVGGYFSKDEILAVAYDRSYQWNVGEHMPEWMDPHAPAAPQERREGMRLEPHSAAPIRADHGLVAGVSVSAEEVHGEDVHAASAKLPILQNIPPLPKGMFWLALIIAYVTPFYMMRCWWLTFMGKPRDHHVHEHAHETPMMYVPLIVLAVGTFVSSYLWFRPLLAHSAPEATDAAMIVGLDGAAEAGHGAEHAATAGEFIDLHAAHEFLNLGVGWSWLAGFLLAWLIYRSGLATAQKLVKLPFIGTAHHVLENKLYFDHVYDFVLVRGCVGLAKLCRYVFDALVDGIVNVSAVLTARFASWTGRQLDMPIQRGDLGLVDAVVNGVAEGMFRLGDGVRRPQSEGRIRVYLMVAAGSAAIVLMAVLFGPQIVDGIGAWMKSTAEAKASGP